MTTTSELSQKLHDFVSAVLTAMGAEPNVAISESPDGFRIDVDGDGAETLLFHRGDALRAFQTIVNTTFRRELGDARKVLVSLTASGNELIAETRRLRTAWFSQRLAELSTEERAALEAVAPILKRLADS